MNKKSTETHFKKVSKFLKDRTQGTQLFGGETCGQTKTTTETSQDITVSVVHKNLHFLIRLKLQRTDYAEMQSRYFGGMICKS